MSATAARCRGGTGAHRSPTAPNAATSVSSDSDNPSRSTVQPLAGSDPADVGTGTHRPASVQSGKDLVAPSLQLHRADPPAAGQFTQRPWASIGNRQQIPVRQYEIGGHLLRGGDG